MSKLLSSLAFYFFSTAIFSVSVLVNFYSMSLVKPSWFSRPSLFILRNYCLICFDCAFFFFFLSFRLFLLFSESSEFWYEEQLELEPSLLKLGLFAAISRDSNEPSELVEKCLYDLSDGAKRFCWAWYSRLSLSFSVFFSSLPFFQIFLLWKLMC